MTKPNTKKGCIPINAAEQLSNQFQLPIVIIFGIEKGAEKFTVTTYGKTKALCKYAADLGNKIAESVLNGKIAPAQVEPADLPDEPTIFESVEF